MLAEAVADRAAAVLRAARHSVTLDPGPGRLPMEAIANPPAYDRARATVRHDDTARALLRAGAAHVDVLVFARVVAPARVPI